MSDVALIPKGEKRPYVMRKGISRLDDLVDGMAMANVALAGAKTIFYVDGNFGSDNQSGVGGWGNAKATLTAALAASHADIASGDEGYAARNVILCKGDALEETLVLLAQKTDIIGVGHDGRYQTGLYGAHVPTGATCSYGTRFFNFHFMGASGGGDIFTLDTYSSGLEFHNCFFDSNTSTSAASAIHAANATDLKVMNCKLGGAFTNAVIELAAGNSRGTEIAGNFIEGAEQGIHLNSSVLDDTGKHQRAILIKDNVIRAATECIYDQSDIAMIMGNMCVTAQDRGTAGAGVIVGKEEFSCDNWISALSSTAVTNAAWPVIGSLSAMFLLGLVNLTWPVISALV